MALWAQCVQAPQGRPHPALYACRMLVYQVTQQADARKMIQPQTRLKALAKSSSPQLYPPKGVARFVVNIVHEVFAVSRRSFPYGDGAHAAVGLRHCHQTGATARQVGPCAIKFSNRVRWSSTAWVLPGTPASRRCRTWNPARSLRNARATTCPSRAKKPSDLVAVPVAVHAVQQLSENIRHTALFEGDCSQDRTLHCSSLSGLPMHQAGVPAGSAQGLRRLPSCSRHNPPKIGSSACDKYFQNHFHIYKVKSKSEKIIIKT